MNKDCLESFRNGITDKMSELPPPVQAALDFEKKNWVDGISVFDDPFYKLPPTLPGPLPVKRLLKVDDAVDRSKFFLPPGTALTRIMYRSENLKGTVVPVSAYVLWPYSPKTHSDGLHPVIAWAHGTSGLNARAGGPSNYKNLWNHFMAPFELVLNGYVVVATDYAGLGVPSDARGRPITHEYLAVPAHANDVVYAVQAAREAFPEHLSKDFVVIGHSQGGGTAWAVAERQATRPVEGLLGSIPLSPTTRILNETEPFRTIIWTAMCEGMKSVITDVDLAKILTPEGLKRKELVYKNGAGLAAALAIIADGAPLLQPEWKENKFVLQYQDMVENGGKPIGCPMLIIQGQEDPRISAAVVSTATKKTKAVNPLTPIELLVLPGITHNGTTTAGQPQYLSWIADRFARKSPVGWGTGDPTILAPVKPITNHAGEQNWYLEAATEFYHAP